MWEGRNKAVVNPYNSDASWSRFSSGKNEAIHMRPDLKSLTQIAPLVNASLIYSITRQEFDVICNLWLGLHHTGLLLVSDWLQPIFVKHAPLSLQLHDTESPCPVISKSLTTAKPKWNGVLPDWWNNRRWNEELNELNSSSLHLQSGEASLRENGIEWRWIVLVVM